VWNETGDTLEFSVAPALYQTSEFRALCAAVFLALLWIAYQLRVRHFQWQYNLRVQERVDERTRIARELHDTLLQSFQGSLYRFQAARNLFSRRPEEAIKTLDSAITSADTAIAQGRDAIQGLRAGPAERHLEDLLKVTGQELRDAQEGSGHRTAFQVIVEGQPRTLSPLLQDEIYWIAREVLRNAFQHAGSTRIEAVIRYDPSLFRLRIRDNGKGIDPKILEQGARPGHWGLPGIRERAKRIGASLKLWSEIGAGTEVELTVPARIAYGTGHRRQGLRLFRKMKVEW
jgi:signal transduction histidine kinase